MIHKGLVSYDPATDIPSLDGKAILITGANTGLGKATALALAQHNPAHIWMASRDASKGKVAVAEVRDQSPGVGVSFLQLDLASFASIKAAARTVLAETKSLDILYLNAGILGAPKGVTEDGYEIHVGVNHMGHALLVKLLAPKLIETASKGVEVRVVALTSHGYVHCKNGIEFDRLKDDGGDNLTPAQGYMRSKLANILYAQETAKHYPQFTTISVTPGDAQTELFSREPGDDQIRYLQTEMAPKLCGTVEDGVKNQLWAGTAEKGVDSGKYYEPVGAVGKEEGFAADSALAKKFWDWTQKELEGHDI